MLGLDSLLDHAKGYIDSKIQLVKLEIQEKLSLLITILFIIIFALFMFLMSLVFLGFAAANYLNSLLNSNHLGFLIIGILFFLMILLILFLKKFIHQIIQQLANQIINKDKN